MEVKHGRRNNINFSATLFCDNIYCVTYGSIPIVSMVTTIGSDMILVQGTWMSSSWMRPDTRVKGSATSCCSTSALSTRLWSATPPPHSDTCIRTILLYYIIYIYNTTDTFLTGTWIAIEFDRRLINVSKMPVFIENTYIWSQRKIYKLTEQKVEWISRIGEKLS